MGKDKSAVIRMHPKTYAFLCREAEAHGLTFSAFVRELIAWRYPGLPIAEDVGAIIEEANTTQAEGPDYLRYLITAAQRAREGLTDLKARLPEASELRAQWQHEIASLETLVGHIDRNIQQHQWTIDLVEWVHKHQGDQP